MYANGEPHPIDSYCGALALQDIRLRVQRKVDLGFQKLFHIIIFSSFRVWDFGLPLIKLYPVLRFSCNIPSLLSEIFEMYFLM